MSPYNEAVTVIESPLYYESEPFWEAGQEYVDLQTAVQRRMLLILAVVSMIVIGLVLFVLPSNTGVAAATDQVASEAAVEPAVSVVEPVAEAQPAAGTAAVSAGSISPIFTKEVRYWETKIVEWAAAHDLDPNIVATIMQIESCGDPQAVSSAGARGLFQVMPFHFSGGEDMLDPDTNARRGLNFYNEQLRYTGGDKLLSFAGYNGGYAASGGNYAGWADETKRYYGWAEGIYGDAQSGATESETLAAWLAAGGAAGCERAASRLNLN